MLACEGVDLSLAQLCRTAWSTLALLGCAGAAPARMQAWCQLGLGTTWPMCLGLENTHTVQVVKLPCVHQFVDIHIECSGLICRG